MTEPQFRALLLEVRLLRDTVAELCEEQRYLLPELMKPFDRRTGAVLFPLVAELVGLDEFTHETLLNGALNDRTATGVATRELLGQWLTDEGGFRAFGRLLSRIEGPVLSGYRLVGAGKANEGRRYRLVRVSDCR